MQNATPMARGDSAAGAMRAPIDVARVDGWGINVPTMSDAVDAVVAAAQARQPAALYTLNLDHLVKLRSHARFRDAYRSARFVTADGAPIVWLARAQGSRVERTTGADMVLPLAEAAARRGLPIFLFGSEAGVLGSAAQRLVSNTAGTLSIAGTEAPAMGFDPEGDEADAAIDRIARSGARICLVALGAPKQELLAARAVARGVPVVFVCIGAALDFIAGTQTRAPDALQRNGMEWMWRLASNPRRLGVRYARCAWLLFKLVTFGSGSSPRMSG